jgi:hypothetical protein
MRVGRAVKREREMNPDQCQVLSELTPLLKLLDNSFMHTLESVTKRIF